MRILFKNIPFAVLAALLLSTLGCATVPRSKTAVRKDAIPLKELCDYNRIPISWDSLSHILTFEYESREIVVMINSPLVIDGERTVRLSQPVKMENSIVLVPAEFKDKIFSRLVRTVEGRREPSRKKNLPPLRVKIKRRVVIDPGHGGRDPGAIGKSGTYEKDVVLDVAKRLEKILRKKGFEVIMTRSTDEFITLQKRTEIASSKRADIFVSVHANSSLARRAQGIEVFSLRPLSRSERNESQRQANQDRMFRSLKMKRDSHQAKNIVSDMLYVYKQAESDLLASTVARELSRTVSSKNRGIKHSRFYVLRNTLVPAVLVEVGFLSNLKEERMLKKKDHRQRIASGISRGVLEYIYER